MSDLIDVSEAASFLNISGQGSQSELSDMVSAASNMITRRVGPVTPTAYSEFYDGGRSQIVLRHTPVLSITSITEAWGSSIIYPLAASVLDGSATDLSNFGYSLDPTIGLLTRRASGVAIGFADGRQNVNVQYKAGYASVPGELRLATKLLVKHLFDSQRGGSRRPGLGGDDSQTSAGTWDDFPSRVEQILENYYTPGIA